MISAFSYPDEPSKRPEFPVEQFERVTVYALGLMGATRFEAREVTIQFAPYAQHSRAMHVRVLKKGCRAWRGWVDTSSDTPLVVVRGWGHPEPREWLEAHGDGTAASRYSSCDPRWAGEMAALVATLPIVADYRKAVQS